MGSARRRIVLDLSTAVKQRSGGVPHISRREMESARRIGLSTAAGIPREMARSRRMDLSTAVKPWKGIPCPSVRCNKNRDLSTVLGARQFPGKKIRFLKSPCTRHDLDEVGYTVDVADLLFTPERDFLVKNNGQKIKVDDLRGKTIVLFIVPLDAYYVSLKGEYSKRPGTGDTLDMIDAYYELQSIQGSDVEFVFVPVRIRARAGSVDAIEEGIFHDIFSTVPFPAIPLSGAQDREGPVVQTFSLDDPCLSYDDLPYWAVIDPTNTVVASRYFFTSLFKLFGGAELYPLTLERIVDLHHSHQEESRLQRISKWDELLASDTRDFLLSSNGDKVPISSLKGKLVGLYFCENISHPPRMEAIKKVYEEAKSRGYDFEIVQITFHYHPFNAFYNRPGTDPSVQRFCEDVSWLTLPFKDPSCRKIQRILHCIEEEDEYWFSTDSEVAERWVGDSLFLIYPHQGEVEAEGAHSGRVLFQLSVAKILEKWGIECYPFTRSSPYKVAHSSGVHFETSGAEILGIWGIEGYPFTRQYLYKLEYEIQKRDLTLQSLFPPGERLLRPAGDGSDLVDAVSQLSGKRVLVLFATYYGNPCDRDVNFLSMLKSEYEAQLEDSESKFEVVYVSTGHTMSSFDEFTKDMPWLVRPYCNQGYTLVSKYIKANEYELCAVAFNEQGELIAKANPLPEEKEGDKLQFPFIDQDLEKSITEEVKGMCSVSNNYVPQYQ